MEERWGDTVLNCNERCWPLQFIAVVANCNAKRVPRQKHCSAVHCNELYAIAAPLQSPQAPRLLRTRVGHCIREFGLVLIFSFAVVGRLVGSPLPGSRGGRHRRYGSAAGGRCGEVAGPLLYCTNVRGGTAKLRFHQGPLSGAAQWRLGCKYLTSAVSGGSANG